MILMMMMTMMKQDHLCHKVVLFNPRQGTLHQWPSLEFLLWLVHLECLREDIKASTTLHFLE